MAAGAGAGAAPKPAAPADGGGAAVHEEGGGPPSTAEFIMLSAALICTSCSRQTRHAFRARETRMGTHIHARKHTLNTSYSGGSWLPALPLASPRLPTCARMRSWSKRSCGNRDFQPRYLTRQAEREGWLRRGFQACVPMSAPCRVGKLQVQLCTAVHARRPAMKKRQEKFKAALWVCQG